MIDQIVQVYTVIAFNAPLCTVYDSPPPGGSFLDGQPYPLQTYKKHKRKIEYGL